MTEVERPFDSDSFHNSPPANQLFDPASMETFRSSHERTPRYSKKNLQVRLDRENRRQQKDQDRAKLFKEVKMRLDDELRQHEDIQAQLHAARDSINRRRTYADKAEKEIETLTEAVSKGSIKEDELAAELAKLQVEFDAYQARMEGIEGELQRARDMTEEITTNRDKAREEAREAREERRKAAEERRLDAARREGMMQGKIEGMYNGWEEGKVLGYKEGRVDGAQETHEEIVNKKWKAIKRELPNYNIEQRIPSPDNSYHGDVPERLKALEAPIILPAQPKKSRTPAPPPATIYYDDDEDIRPKPFHSPEQMYSEMEPETNPRSQRMPPPIPSNLYNSNFYEPESTQMQMQMPMPMTMPQPNTATNAPSSSRAGRGQPQPIRTRTNIPPPQPIFSPNQEEWQPAVTRPEELKRSRTWQALEKRLKRSPQEVSQAPHDMDFAPMAAPPPMPTLATPLPHSQILQPGRAVPTPAPSLFREPRYAEEESEDDRRGRRGRRSEDQPEASRGESRGGSGVLTRLTSLIRGQRNQPAIDPLTHPMGYQDVHSTPNFRGRNSMIGSPTPSPSLRPQNLSQPGTPVWPPPSRSHSRMSMLPDNYIPPLEADGGISLPPPHELEGNAMQSAISSQNPSRNPSPSRSQRSFQRGRSKSQEPSPTRQRLNQIGHSLKDAASAAVHRIPSRSKIQSDFRGRSRSRSPMTPITPDSPDPVHQIRNRSRSRDRPRSGMNGPYIAVPPEGLLKPEHIMVGPTVSDPNLAEDNSMQRGRGPARKGTAASQMSGKSSPFSQISILEMGGGGGALGLSRGSGEPRGDRDPNFVTYPNASMANLSVVDEEERERLSNYNRSPSPMRRPQDNIPPPQMQQQYPQRPPHGARQFSDSSMTMADYNSELREPWDPNSRYPPPPPSMRSMASGNHPPPPPMKSPQTSHNPYPWPNRPVPSKLTMPALLSAQSPTPSSRGGIAGIGAGGGYHKRATSATALGLPMPNSNFASPHPSARLSMVGSYAGSDSGRPPIAPKPQPPNRRNRSNPIVLDDPLPEGTPHHQGRSWSGEQRQIGHTVPTRSRANSNAQQLVTLEERSPYLQGPGARGSTGSVGSVHSNRLKFDQNQYRDPAFLIQSDLVATLEREVGAPAPPSDSDAQPKKVTAKMGKRISKVLKFGSKK